MRIKDFQALQLERLYFYTTNSKGWLLDFLICQNHTVRKNRHEAQRSLWRSRSARTCLSAVSTEVRTALNPKYTRSTFASEITTLPWITTPECKTWSNTSTRDTSVSSDWNGATRASYFGSAIAKLIR